MRLLRVLEELIKNNLPPYLVISLIAIKKYWFGEPELRLLRKLVDSEKSALDIGANKGVYSYYLSWLSRHVCSYEPNPAIAKFLEEGARQNVDVFNVALSNEVGTAKLRLPVINGIVNEGRASLEGALHDESVTNIQEFEVNTRKLDDEGHKDIGFIKIDVEGHEMSVLRGGRELILGERPVMLIEIEQRHLSIDMEDVIKYVVDMGYSVYFLLDGNVKPIEIFDKNIYQRSYSDADKKPDYYVNNFIFIPNENQKYRSLLS